MEEHEEARLNAAFARAVCADVTASAVAMALAKISPEAKEAIIEHLDLALVTDAYLGDPELSEHPLVKDALARIAERLERIRAALPHARPGSGS